MKINVSGLFKMKNSRIIKTLWLAVFCVLAFSLSPFSSAQAATWYVDVNVTGGNGTTWATAYQTIQEAIDDPATVADDEIWVKQGTYNLTTQIDVDKAVSIYGGFNGTEPPEFDPAEREWETNVTTVNGDLAVDHCFYMTVDATIDGFTITGGLANGGGIDDQGAGIFVNACSATIANCTVELNQATAQGGGIFIIDSPLTSTITNCSIAQNTALGGGGIYLMQTSSPTMITMITNCIFDLNDADEGGAIYDENSISTIITNCTFFDNVVPLFSSLGRGGGIYNFGTVDSIITNCVFSGNSTNHHGGAIANNQSPSTITNCTFSGNHSDNQGGAIYNFYTNPDITNCILWGDTADIDGDEIYDNNSSPVVTYCNVQGGYTGDGNIDIDPNFVGAPDYRLLAGSLAIDAGDNTALPADLADLDDDDITDEVIPYDLDGNERRFDDTATPDTGYPPADAPYVDMGAYEYQAYTLTMATGGTGTGTVTPTVGEHPYNYGTVVDLVAGSADGSTFTGWTGDIGDVADPSSATTTVTITSNIAITANFSLDQHTLTMMATGGTGTGTVTPTVGEHPYNYGTVVDLVAGSADGSTFTGWTGDIGDVADPSSATTTVTITSNIAITANFSLNTYAVNVSSTPGGITDQDGTHTINHGDTLTINPTPDSGYRFTVWSGDASGSDDPLVVTVTGPMTITANFALLGEFTVSFVEGANGSITGTLVQNVPEFGSTTPVEAVPTTGYEFTNWTGTGGFTSIENPLTINNVTSNMTITANFDPFSYTLTMATDGTGNGTLNPAVGDHIYGYNTIVTITATANATSVFGGWSGDVADSDAETTTVTITGDMTVTATFASDGDSDGISDNEEDGAPNGGDGNNDGTLDSLQNNVTSLLTYDGQDYVTIESASGTLNDVEAIDNPSPSDSPSGTDFNYGLFDFTITGLNPGDPVTLYLPAGAAPTKYYKYGPTPTDPVGWYEFDFDGTTGAVINGNEITLHFVDGDRGDDDLTANGTIVEPGGPAFASTSTGGGGGGGGGGGCFIATTSSGLSHITAIPMIPYLALMLLLFVIGKAAHGGRKR